jgi:hypothetical protein
MSDPQKAGNEFLRARSITGGTTLEQAPSVAKQCEFLDQFDYRAHSGGSLWMVPDQGTAVVVHGHQVRAGLA